jgi:hypothetical protein
MEKLIFFLFHGERMGDGRASGGAGTSIFVSLSFFLSGPEFFIFICSLLKGRASGKTAPRANLERAWLALLDALSDGNTTPHDRLLYLGEAFSMGLA